MFRDVLKGTKVVDFTHLGAGPMCTMLLGDMGADVLKVESRQGEIGRKLGPGWIGDDGTAYYGFNRNKRSISLDLKKEEGRSVARRMIESADVLVESLKPGSMRKLGLGFEEAKALNDKIIYCSISAYGQQGPYASRPGVDGILQADCGLMNVIGSDGDQEPSKVQAPVVDVMTGYIAAMSIVAKVLDVHRSGHGGFIDVNLMHAALTLQQATFTNYLSERIEPAKIGSAAPYSAPNEAFPTQDGWIMVAAYSGTRWQDLCRILDLPWAVDDERFTTSQLRVENRAAMKGVLIERFMTQPTAYWLPRMLGADILCAKVSNYADLALHPQALANNMFTSFAHPKFGEIQTVGFPVNSAIENSVPHTLPPGCGQHSREILAEQGFSFDDIQRLIDHHVVFEPAGI